MRHGLLADRGMPPSRQRRRGGGGVRAWCERVEGLAAIAINGTFNNLNGTEKINGTESGLARSPWLLQRAA